jgi:hypothetical protein
LKLIYRASWNEFSVEEFKDKCENISHTVTLIHTHGDFKIGGYTPLKWKRGNSKPLDDDKKTFLFSLTDLQYF